MKMPFEVTWEKITPEIAREMLTHNHNNRRLRNTTVVAYARDMRMGEWLSNHQGIAFDEAGSLIDGQHRLAAVVISGVAICALVARGVPTKIDTARATTMDTIDRGAGRTIADMLKLGHGTVDANAVQAICALLVIYGVQQTNRARKMSLPQALAVIDLWRADITFAVQGRAKQLGLRSAPVMAALAFAHAVKPKLAKEFYEQLVTGEGIFKGTPVFTLREYLLANIKDKARSERLKVIEFILTAIHLHGKKAKMERCHIDKDAVHLFRDGNKDRIARIEELFPPICEGSIKEALDVAKLVAPASDLKPGEVRLTAYAEDLLRGKAMAEKFGTRVGGGGGDLVPRTGKPKKNRGLRSKATNLPSQPDAK